METMSDAESAEGFLGKKVFFVYPPSVIQNELVIELYRHEYEVFLLKGHEDALKVAKKYPDCILFINIDEGLRESEWESFIASLKSDPGMGQVGIGIVTYNNSPDLAKKYLIDLGINAGFVKLSLGLKESLNIITRTLEANEAKGRRKYLRARCANNAVLNLQAGQTRYQGDVLDISSAGFAASFGDDPVFKTHEVVKNVQLRLKGVIVTVTCVVMGSRIAEDNRVVYVFLLDPKTEPEPRQKIRAFISQTLNAEILEELKRL